QPDQTLIDQYFPEDADGPLHKSNNWNEGTDNANSTSAPVDNVLRHFLSGGQPKLARYRWNWRPRASRSSNDFSDLFKLIDAVAATPTTYRAAVESVVDVENWMRTFAFHDLCSYWDGFGNPNHKNTYLYKPPAGRWIQFSWDMDVGLGVFNDPVDATLFPATVDTRVDALQAFPAFRRIYWRTVHEALATFFSGAAVTPLLQKKFATFAPNGVNLTSPFVASGAYGLSIPQWIDQRRTYLQSQLNSVQGVFALTSPAQVTVEAPAVTLTGTAPVQVKTLTVNGVALPVTWSSVLQWRISLVPLPGTHSYAVRAVDYNGVEVGSATVRVTFTGTSAWPPLRLNEWMASNAGVVNDPADGRSDDWLELYNPTADLVSLTGWRLRDLSPTPTEYVLPGGCVLAPGARLVAWCDEETAQNAPPDSLHLPFSLSAEGETLTLAAPDGTVIDQVSFGPQVANVSSGRVPDGGSGIDFLESATPGLVNAPVSPPPAATAVAWADGTVAISLSTIPGFQYQLQTKAALSDPTWKNDGLPVTALGASLTLVSSPTSSPERYYRAVRHP
ncbi:MAG: lamin tail domain-containing protein, partial [Verrucomicrobiales bacterium]